MKLAHSTTVGVTAILLSTLAEALGQLSFKEAAGQARRPGQVKAKGLFWRILIRWRWIMLGFFGFIIDGIFWSIALYFLDITVVHPVGSVVFVVVAILSRVILKERISPRRWAGISLILAGSVVVAVS